MSEPYAIRLAGPWDYEVLRSDSATPAATNGRVQLPADWATTFGPSFRGAVRFVRKFNRPTNLEPREQVWIVFEGATAAGEALLNGRRLGPIESRPAAEYDVTSLLQLHNALTVTAERSDAVLAEGDLFGSVRLEIRFAGRSG